MSTEDTARETAVLARQLDEVTRSADSLCAALGRARKVRMALFLLLLLFVTVIVVAFYKLGSHIMSDENQNAIITLAQQRLQENSNSYMNHVQTLVDHSSPVLTKAFNQQVEKDLPLFARALEKERDTLGENLRQKTSAKLEAHYHNLIRSQEDTLMREYPQTKDQKVRDAVQRHLEVAMDALLRKYYVDEIKGKMDKLFATWDNFPRAPAPKKGQGSTEEQFEAALWQLFVTKISNTSGFAP